MDTNDRDYDRIIGVFGIRRLSNAERGVYYSDAAFIEGHLESLDGWYNSRIKIIAGGSSGVELLAEQWCGKKQVPFQRVKPLLHQNGINPFDIRNETIIRMSTEILVFWDAEDNQVASALRESMKRGRKVTLIPILEK